MDETKIGRYRFNDVFLVDNGRISPRIPVRIGGITMGPGVSFGGGVSFSGVDLKQHEGKDIAENELSIAFYDKFPVTSKHVLIIPKRHCIDYFELSQPEINAMNRLTHVLKEQLKSEDSNISGFNIGFNSGEDAGQTVLHCHMHLIPRRKGDVENPIGGVRNLIPGKGDYKTN